MTLKKKVVLVAVILAVLLGAAITIGLSHHAAAGNCDCSKCSSDQYCCPTANGYCGCFPMPCP